MYKAVCMFKLDNKTNENDFEDFFKKHVLEAKALKNLKKYTIAKVIDPEDKENFYRINELYYENIEDLEESFASDLAKEATDDLLKRVKDFKCIILKEEIIL